MRTLLENITLVKGVEYMIVIAFCFGFIALWVLVHADKGTKKKIVATIIPLAMIFAGGAIVLNNYFTEDLTVSAATQEESSIATNNQLSVNPDYLTVNYGKATEFHKIMSDKIACTTCHHNSKEVQPCKNCHDKPFNLSNDNKPGLKAAYHQRCIGCHQDKFNGPESCAYCHNGNVSQIIAPMLHSLTWENCNKCHTDNKDSKIVYHNNCLTCHTKSSTGAPKLSNSHAEHTADTCQGCHKQNI